MVSTKLLLGLLVCLIGTTAYATTRAPRVGASHEFCNLQQLTATQPNNMYQYEGGSIETWDFNQDQLQCVGVAPLRKTIRSNAMSLPNFSPAPRLLFIEQGEGIVGVHFPGCAETFDTGVEQLQSSRRMGEQGGDFRSGDSHQKVHRFRRGDIVAVPAGTVKWVYNDGNEDVVFVSIHDNNNPANQLDLEPVTFFLAGGSSRQLSQQQQQQQGQGQQKQQQQQQGEGFLNVFAGFDRELLAEAFNSDPEIIRSMQEPQQRGLIVNVQQPMQFVTPDEQRQQQQYRGSQQQQPGSQQQQGGEQGSSSNGLEEGVCSTKITYNLDNQKEADIFSREAGKLSTVNEHKLPILSYLDLGAEKGHLQPNALISPHWAINAHSIIYVLSGDAQVQVVSNNGEAVLDQQVRRGDLFVVPQFFATTARAGQNGFEWVAFKTNRSPMKSPVAGYTSVFRAMPLEVIQNAYQISPSQAQSLKMNRETESILFSPQRSQSQSQSPRF